LVGEVEGEVGEGIEALENEEAGDPIRQFGSGKLVFVPGFPVEGTGQVE
jgi:hypothetical protein